MFNHLSLTYKGIIFALAGYTGFSVADICAKWLSQHYSVYQIVVIDTAVASLFLLAFAPFIGGMKDVFERKSLPVHIARMVLNFVINLISVYSLSRLPIASVYTLIFMMPFWAALMAVPLYGEKLTLPRMGAICAGFAGVVIALSPWNAEFNPLLLLPLGGSVLIAIMFLVSRSLQGSSIFALGIYPLFGSCLMTIPLALADFKAVDITGALVFLLQGGALAVAIVGVSLAFRTAAAAVVAPFLYTQMIWALIFGYVIFGDAPGWAMLAGAGIIILSGIYLVETERRKQNA